MPLYRPEEAYKELYGRRVQVVFGKQGEEGAKLDSRSPIGGKVEGHRIDFTVSGGRDGSPYKGNIKIFNPDRRDAATLINAGRDGFVSLSAGYGDRADKIFSGIPMREGVHMSRDPDGTYILNIEALGVSEEVLRARVSVSVAGPISATQVLILLAVQTGWDIGPAVFKDTDVFPRGYTYTGKAHEAFRRLAAFTRTALHYNGNVVEFLPPDSAPAGFDRVVRFSERDGNLLSLPVVTDRGLSFKGMLDASVEPGRQVSTVFRDFVTREMRTRNILVQDRTFNGSSHAVQFHVKVNGREILS